MEFTLAIDADAFKKSLKSQSDNFEAAFNTTKNMIASMLRKEITADIQSAGNFGDKYLEGLSVEVEGDTITTELDAPGASLFEDGGTIEGHPLLWIPISGTDAEGIRAKDYGDQLFSVNRKTGGVPLLFSVKDKAPKYFGTPSVNIPKRFHLTEIQLRVMENFKDIFNSALKDANG